MTISHNNHYWGNIASDGAVVVGGNSFPSPLPPQSVLLDKGEGLGDEIISYGSVALLSTSFLLGM